MENESFGQKVKNTTRKIVKRTLLLVLVVGLGYFSFRYWAVYEVGTMAGKVIRISQQGIIFKTYEGKLNNETFGTLKGASPLSESYDFSVEGSETEVIKQLQEVSLTGERVSLHFIKRYGIFPWRGDTKVFITAVERLK